MNTYELAQLRHREVLREAEQSRRARRLVHARRLARRADRAAHAARLASLTVW